METVRMLIVGITAALGLMALGTGALIVGVPSHALRRPGGKPITAKEQGWEI